MWMYEIDSVNVFLVQVVVFAVVVVVRVIVVVLDCVSVYSCVYMIRRAWWNVCAIVFFFAFFIHTFGYCFKWNIRRVFFILCSPTVLLFSSILRRKGELSIQANLQPYKISNIFSLLFVYYISFQVLKCLPK